MSWFEDLFIKEAEKALHQHSCSGGDSTESGGIYVTGATPGQTVKITAVDENGVPTAWKSADFPSGETVEEWEEICNITVGEDVYTQHILTQSEGKKYKKILALIESCGTKTVLCGRHYNGTLFPDVYSGTNNAISGAVKMITKGKYNCFLWHKNEIGTNYQLITRHSSVGYDGDATTAYHPVSLLRPVGYNMPYIDMLTVYSNDTSTPITSGGKVIVKGVRY